MKVNVYRLSAGLFLLVAGLTLLDGRPILALVFGVVAVASLVANERTPRD